MTDIPKNGLWDWEGRIGRLKYFLILLATSLPIGFLSMFAEHGAWVVIILMLPMIYIQVLAVIKRFHDLCLTGWYALLTLIPFVNLAAGLYLLFAKGNSCVNKYGPPPIDQSGVDIPPQPMSQLQSHTGNSSQQRTQLPVASAPHMEPASTHERNAQNLNVGTKEPTSIQVQDMENIEDRLYEQIAQEIEANTVDKATWTKAFAQSGGDDKQTRVLYIKARFDRLMAAENARLEAVQHEREEVTRREQEQHDRECKEAERFELLCKRIKVAESTKLDEAKKLATSVEWFDFQNWCSWGFVDKVKDAVEKNPLFLAIANSGGNTALHLALIAKQLEMAKFLADKGASVSMRNSDGETPLDIAKKTGQLELVELLQ